MPAPPTKAGLQAAVERLTRENAVLRELIAAVHETAAAGDAINMDGDVWGAGGRAAQRIAIWLGDDTAHADIVRVERQARLFREHLESITSLGKPAATCGATATDNAGRLRECERPGDGHTAHQHAGDGVRTSMFIWEDDGNQECDALAEGRMCILPPHDGEHRDADGWHWAGVPGAVPYRHSAGDAAEAADPGYLEDAAAQDDDEAGDPFLGHAPSGMQDPAPVVRRLDGGELPRRVPPASLDGATARTGGAL